MACQTEQLVNNLLHLEVVYFGNLSALYHSSNKVFLTLGRLGDEVDGPGLAPESLSRSVDPDVHDLGLLGRLLESKVPAKKIIEFL